MVDARKCSCIFKIVLASDNVNSPGKDAHVLEKKLFMDLEKRVHGVSTNHTPVWTIFSHVRKKVFIYSLRC
jgi:hypothetical protein